MDEEGVDAGGKAGMSRKLVAGIIVAAVVAAAVGYIVYSQNDNNQIEISDKTFLLGRYSWNGFSYQATSNFIVIFNDGTLIKLSYDINSNDSYGPDSIILEGQNNFLDEDEIREIMVFLNDTIPDYSNFVNYGFVFYYSNKTVITQEELDDVVETIANSDFLLLNDTYEQIGDATDGGLSWITVNFNQTYKKVRCYDYWPPSYQEVWVMITALDNTYWGDE